MAQTARFCSEPPNIVVIGLPNVAALNRAVTKLKAANILHYAWHEPDFNFGFTAIATAPIEGKQREALANYRVYNFTAVAQIVERLGSREDAGSLPAGCTNISYARSSMAE
jgi:hypothetical protein